MYLTALLALGADDLREKISRAPERKRGLNP